MAGGLLVVAGFHRLVAEVAAHRRRVLELLARDLAEGLLDVVPVAFVGLVPAVEGVVNHLLRVVVHWCDGFGRSALAHFGREVRRALGHDGGDELVGLSQLTLKR